MQYIPGIPLAGVQRFIYLQPYRPRVVIYMININLLHSIYLAFTPPNHGYITWHVPIYMCFSIRYHISCNRDMLYYNYNYYDILLCVVSVPDVNAKRRRASGQMLSNSWLHDVAFRKFRTPIRLRNPHYIIFQYIIALLTSLFRNVHRFVMFFQGYRWIREEKAILTSSIGNTEYPSSRLWNSDKSTHTTCHVCLDHVIITWHMTTSQWQYFLLSQKFDCICHDTLLHFSMGIWYWGYTLCSLIQQMDWCNFQTLLIW